MSRIRDNVVVLTGSNSDFDHLSEQYNKDLIQKIKVHAGDGKTLVMRGLDCIYPALYDLFNKRFASYRGSRQSCSVSYEDYKDTMIIHPEFKVIVVKDESELFRPRADMERVLPSALINRFEKHIIKQADVYEGGSSALPNRPQLKPRKQGSLQERSQQI